MSVLLYVLFFLSGISGLIYQVVWVREFGNVFGNTVYSTSIVLAIFMLGLGAGSYLMGAWADRRYARAPQSMLQAYGYVELLIAALGLVISLVLPNLAALSAAVSAYTPDNAGWNTLTIGSYIGRGAIAVILLAPITLLMGGTLTLLIRHLVRAQVAAGGWLIALLYGANTLGAAAGALLTDFVLVPAIGLQFTQAIAVVLNVVAGAGALYLASRAPVRLQADTPPAQPLKRGKKRAAKDGGLAPEPTGATPADARGAVAWTSVAIALSGFAAMGMEILWLRHFNLLLGGFRAVFSLLLAVVLVGIGLGSLAGGAIARRTTRAAEAFMVVQGLFVVATLLGVASQSLPALNAAGRALVPELAAAGPWGRSLIEFMYNVRPMLVEVLVPALLMGCSFPLANAIVQRAEMVVGRRAGTLYLANTAGAVVGTIAAGYLLLPSLGIQGSATVLMVAAALAIVPLFVVARGVAPAQRARAPVAATAAAAIAALAGLGVWLSLPNDFILQRSQVELAQNERVIAVSEGVTEVIAVTEIPDRGRGLITNGHPMSSTARLDQRYMRAMAHIPLLSLPSPQRVLVIGFGVGNTTHAATLHPSVQRIDVADLSRHVLEQSSYFRDANGGVIGDPRVQVFVNDGRQHLLMQPEASYDLITLEPPPIAQAGVASLYSREFYALARSRLKPGGYVSQWLPAYQVPVETSLALVRAFVEVFPASVLLSGAQAEFLLIGRAADTMEVDPAGLERALAAAPAAAADLTRFDLGSVTEIVGTFVSSGQTLAQVTTSIAPATDNRPLQEYGVQSGIATGLLGVPAAIVDLGSVGDWCPKCFGADAALVGGLDLYLALMYEAYNSPVSDVVAAARADRTVLGSRYLGAVLPESPGVHNSIGTMHLRLGRADEARAEFLEALRLDPQSAEARKNLGAVQHAEGNDLLQQGRYAEALQRLQAALAMMPDSAALHNDIGIAYASMGNLAAATEQFTRAVELEPDFAEARQNLEKAERR